MERDGSWLPGGSTGSPPSNEDLSGVSPTDANASPAIDPTEFYKNYRARQRQPRNHKGNCACRCAKAGRPREQWCYCDDETCCPKLRGPWD